MRSYADDELIYEALEEAYYDDEPYLTYDLEETDDERYDPFLEECEEMDEFDEFDEWDEPEIEERYDFEEHHAFSHPPEVWDKRYLLLFVAFIIFFGAGAVAANSNDNLTTPSEQIPETDTVLGGQPRSFAVDNPTAVVAPYKDYTLTQGLHGQSYGHLAIDLAAGRGEPVLSPINGIITDLYVDEYNNTTLVIENDVYQVIMLHGDFNVELGDQVSAGQAVGSEGNNGYTMDFFGNLCYGRPHCGNHTHLNIFDKRIQANVNPLDLMR